MGQVRAVLFDVGGPLDAEVISERLIDEHIREALAAEGIEVSDTRYAEADRYAVESFALNAYQAIIWHLSGRNAIIAKRVYQQVAQRSPERNAARDGVELREDIPALLETLAGRGVLLGLAANQPANMVSHLDRVGVGRYFRHREVSGSHGLRKPDVRLFLRCCDDLGVRPDECVMVGDRIDNDIVPARALGMRTVLYRTGRHRAQQPRSWEEVPDIEVRSVEAMQSALLSLLDGSGGR